MRTFLTCFYCLSVVFSMFRKILDQQRLAEEQKHEMHGLTNGLAYELGRQISKVKSKKKKT